MENNQEEEHREAQNKTENDLLSSNWNQVVPSFEEMKLKRDLLRGIFGYGYEKPSVIQTKGILPVMMHKDIIAQAQSGSGKTATFTIGMLQNIDTEDTKLQALILAPTRELAMQINGVVNGIGTYLKIKTHVCTGGSSVSEDRRKLAEGVNVVVGTPGRVRDLIMRGAMGFSCLKMLIIDEADEMLSLGFIEQINQITEKIPPDCQICLFSATMAEDIIKLASEIMTEPAKILVKKEELTLEGIKQYYLACSNEKAKFDNLIEIFGNIDINQCIIYANTKEKVMKLEEELKQKDFIVSCIHGALEQEKRNDVMKEFRDGVSRILVSTDLLARGIDVHQVGLVINYELPSRKENYIHRIGRSGRFGRRGIAINLISNNEVVYLMEIQAYYQTQIKELPQDLLELEN